MINQSGGQEQATPTTQLRPLVACPDCKLQYDTSKRPADSRFRCGCGKLLTVPKPRVHDASVVRCSSCGAPRQQKGESCGFCGADFTLHERDLHTICPGCFARIGDRARFCHYCGLRITPQGKAGDNTNYGCPVCPDKKLTSRKLGGDEISVLECGKCGGLWLGHELFTLLQEKAREKEISWLDTVGRGSDKAPSPRGPHQGALYRRCLVCGKHMSRRNFKRRSGVIVDVCPSDGVWFDLGELDRVLDWIQSGGMSRARVMVERRAQQKAVNRRLRRSFDPLERAGAGFAESSSEPGTGDFISGVVRFLLDG
jgi:Zn-finger nucleic acid-binding protein